VGEEIEALENHPDVRALPGDVGILALVEPPVAFFVTDQLTVHPDAPTRQGLHLIDQPQEGRLARPGGPEQHHCLAGVDVQVDALEDFVGAERLVDVDGPDQRLATAIDVVDVVDMVAHQ